MKKILLSILLLVAISTQAQTYTIANQLKLGTVNLGSSSDSVLVRGVDKIVKYVPASTIKVNSDSTKVDKVSGERLINASEITNLSNQSGVNTGNNAVNSNYESDYRATNFAAGVNYQSVLVSGINIKTINGNPILGSGDLVLSAGSVPDVSGTVSGIVNNTSLQELGGVDKLISGYRIGKGNFTAPDLWNTVLGKSVLQSNTTGDNIIAIGWEALKNNTTGTNNTAVGSTALRAGTTGSDNTALGTSSLRTNTTGAENTGLGSYSLYTNTTGANNTAVGKSSLQLNTTGGFNTAVGGYALESNTTGIVNTAIGYAALDLNTTGGYNIALGTNALGLNQFGSSNTAIGYKALYNNVGNPGGNVSGHRSVAIGTNAMLSNTTGNGVAVGTDALRSQITATDNIAMGWQAGNAITGSGNLVIASTGFIALGGGITSGSNNMILSPNTGNTTGITTGSGNAIVGKVTGLSANLSNTVIVSDGVGTQRFLSDSTGLDTLPTQTNALINSDATGKAIITNGWFSSKIGVAAPSSSTATGVVGEIRVCSDGYIYWCTATNTWIRSAGVTF